MFAIMNKKTGRFVYGTDYRYYPPHQRTSIKQMLTFSEPYFAKITMNQRGCGENYAVVELEPVKIKRIVSNGRAVK